MRKSFKISLFTILSLLVLLSGILGALTVFTKNQAASASAANTAPSAKIGPAPQVISFHTVNMSQIAPTIDIPAVPGNVEKLPILTGTTAATYTQRKANAAHTTNAPTASYAYQNTGNVNTPGTTTKFRGMADSASICPPFGCQPPDQALAASPNWVFQGVNSSWSVYNTTGTVQAGWPKKATKFFGVPALPNNCDPNGPFMSDPRAFYDANDGRFWAASLQLENAFGIGTNCPFQSRYWIAVSQTNNPNGTWNIYAFDMSLGTLNAADYTQFGFDAQAIYFSANMFSSTVGTYQYAEIMINAKATLEAGAAAAPHTFFHFTLGGVELDTIQPVETQAYSYSGPNVGFLINSLNINSGGGQCFTGCSGLVLWAVAHPASASPSMTGAFIATQTYTMPPAADQPGAPGSIETLDTRISGTPVYHSGLISFALETGANNGTQVVPSIFWGQVLPAVTTAGAITGASLIQSGIVSFKGDTAASFGALISDNDGNLFMVLELMSNTINPRLEYLARRVTFTPGLFPDTGVVIRAGDAPTVDSRWGDFEATSYDGVTTDNVWFAGEYSSTNGDWSTYIAKSKFTLTTL